MEEDLGVSDIWHTWYLEVIGVEMVVVFSFPFCILPFLSFSPFLSLLLPLSFFFSLSLSLSLISLSFPRLFMSFCQIPLYAHLRIYTHPSVLSVYFTHFT